MLRRTEKSPSGLRLEYLDGLRGLTALYVVLFHCRSEFTWRQADGGFSPLLRAATEWMNFGHYAVVVFIVLSGYCLMLPVVRSRDEALAGGFWGYLKRRARRTLPAYYGAIAFSLLLIAAFPALRQQVGAQWDRCLPAFQTDVLLAHLLMLHNLRFAWHQTIDAPLWSMATEWGRLYCLRVAAPASVAAKRDDSSDRNGDSARIAAASASPTGRELRLGLPVVPGMLRFGHG